MIRALEVVAHVQIRRAVVVHVLKAHRQGPVTGFDLERAAVLVEESAFGEGHAREAPRAVVPVKRIRLAVLEAKHLRPVHFDEILVPKLRRDDVRVALFLHDALPRDPFGRKGVAEGEAIVVRHVEVEVAVAVGVGERHRGRTRARGQTRRLRRLGEAPRAVVHEDRVRPAHRRHEQVHVPVAVEVLEDRARREAPVGGHTRLRRHVLEAPSAEVAIERVRPFEAGEVDVRPSVAVHVGERHARAVHIMPVGEEAFLAERIDEREAGFGGVDGLEARRAAFRRGEFGPPVAFGLVPHVRRCLLRSARRKAPHAENHRRHPGPLLHDRSSLSVVRTAMGARGRLPGRRGGSCPVARLPAPGPRLRPGP